MSFEIYFDESNKLDKLTSKFSYYGVIGCKHSDRVILDKKKSEIGFRSELHFVDFNLGVLDYYLNIFKYSLDFIKTNIYIVDNKKAIKTGEDLNLNITFIRNLLYMKIPERLIYGILRELQEFDEIDIYIDQWDGYGNKNSEFFNEVNLLKVKDILESNCDDSQKIRYINTLASKIYNHVQIPKSLKEQLNAQCIYRDLNCKIKKCTQANSSEYIGLQITDVLLGIFSFLFEEKYLEMPKVISEQLMSSLLKLLNENEKELINRAYKQDSDSWKLNTHKDDMNIISDLKKLNKKLNIYDTKNIMKSEFIYLILSDNETLKKLLNLNIYTWPDNENDTKSTIGKTYISQYVSVFLNFKNTFDNANMKSIIDFHDDKISQVKYNFSDYRNHLNYPSRLSRLIERYLNHIGIQWVDMK